MALRRLRHRWKIRAERHGCDSVIKDKSNKPWPQWAVQAKAAGWTPPKGWKP